MRAKVTHIKQNHSKSILAEQLTGGGRRWERGWVGWDWGQGRVLEYNLRRRDEAVMLHLVCIDPWLSMNEHHHHIPFCTNNQWPCAVQLSLTNGSQEGDGRLKINSNERYPRHIKTEKYTPSPGRAASLVEGTTSCGAVMSWVALRIGPDICSSIGGIGSRGYNAQQLDGGVRECTVPQDSHEYPLAEHEMKRMDSRCDPRQHNMTATATTNLPRMDPQGACSCRNL